MWWIPLLQKDFCLAILKEAEHRAVHTAMESCGQAPEETILAACDKLDYLLFDIKHLDSEAHKKATGMGNERILRNLAAVRSAYPHLPIHLRTPLIPGINDDEDTLIELSDKLLMARIKPYYLFQGDPVKGTKHLRVDIERGLEIEKNLRRSLSGLGMPQYTADLPRGGGKVILTHSYLEGKTEKDGRIRYIFTTPEGETRYYPE